MKKLAFIFALLGLFTFMTPKVITAGEPCGTTVLTCPDGSQHYIVFCDFYDIQAWAEILCGLGTG